MSREELTPEEAEALEVMARDDMSAEPEETEASEQDAATDDAPEQESEPDRSQTEAEQPEFKSSRTDDKPPEGYVPHQAMHAERLRRQELEKKLEALEARLSQPEPEQPPQYVDPLEDPEGHRRYVDYHNQQSQRQIQQVQEQIQRQQQQQQIAQSVSQAEAQFMQQTPDYKDAIKYLQDTRMKELTSQGYDPQSAMRQMSQDAMGIYQAAQQMGMNPAQMAYLRAQSLGYTPQQGQQSQRAPQGDAQRVEALAKAQEQTSGISGSGAPQKGKLTLQALAEMSEEQLAEIPEKELRKVMEG